MISNAENPFIWNVIYCIAHKINFWFKISEKKTSGTASLVLIKETLSPVDRIFSIHFLLNKTELKVDNSVKTKQIFHN